MFESIWEDIKLKYRTGNALIRIIIFNVGFFIFINLAAVILKNVGDGSSYQSFLEFFMISTDIIHNLTHPWVLFTHMFLHESLWHIFWNMFWLYMFGNIIGDLVGDRVVLPAYLLSGLFGGAMYFLAGNLQTHWPIGPYALGASAAVSGYIMLCGFKFPDYTIRLILIGVVPIKYIAAFFLLMDVFAFAGSYNSGGHFAHLGGAFMGWLIVYLWQKQNVDLIEWANNIIYKVENFFKNLFSKKPSSKMKVDYRSPKIKKTPPKKRSTKKSEKDLSHQEKLDAILDKINRLGGVEALTEEEKDFLYKASKK